MPRAKILLPSLIGVALLAGSAQASWLFLSTSVFQAEEHKQKHPTTLMQTLALPEDTITSNLCVAYKNNFKKKNKGSVETTVRLSRGTDSIESLDEIATFELEGNIKDNGYFECMAVPDMERGDILTFETTFKKLPKLKIKKKTDYFVVHGSVSLGELPSDAHLYQPQPEQGGWLHFANTILKADINDHPHPEDWEQAIIVPQDTVAPQVCSSYLNSASNKNQGSVSARVSIARDIFDISLEQFNLDGDISKNGYVDCKTVDDLPKDSVVFFEYDFHGVPDLKTAQVDWAGIRGVVSTAGQPSTDTSDPPDDPDDPPPPDDDPPPPDDDPPPPPPSGQLSEADQRAVSSLLLKTTKTQLWRSKNNNPTKWTVVGPKTKAIEGTNKLIASTAGYGNTIAAALADYEKKKGKLAAGDLLTKKEREAIEWYCGIGTSGPTSVRHDSSGNFHGEYYRTGKGAQHHGPVGKMTTAIDWLKSQGL